MDKQITGEIRRITIGGVKDGFCFTVGQTIHAGSRDITLTKIIRNENQFYFFGVVRYEIYAKHEGAEFLWNYFENQPVRVELAI